MLNRRQNLDDRIYYVYVYLDIRKPGVFEYLDYKFDYEPFYVGKGSNDRDYFHLDVAKITNWSTFKYNKIRSIIRETNDEPIISRVVENLTEKEALKLEYLLVKDIGFYTGNCYDHKVGPLTNRCPGGGNPPRPIAGQFHTSRASKNGTHWWFGEGNPVHNQIKYRWDHNLPHQMQIRSKNGTHWWFGEGNPVHAMYADPNYIHHRHKLKQHKLIDKYILNNRECKVVELTYKKALRFKYKKFQDLYTGIYKRIKYFKIKGCYLLVFNKSLRKNKYFFVNDGTNNPYYEDKDLLWKVVLMQ